VKALLARHGFGVASIPVLSPRTPPSSRRRGPPSAFALVAIAMALGGCQLVGGIDDKEIAAAGGGPSSTSSSGPGSGGEAASSGPGGGAGGAPSGPGGGGAGPGGGTPGMLLVRGGPFFMGCKPADPACADPGSDDEKPYHEVTLPAFEVDVIEVTQAAYQECIDQAGCTVVNDFATCDPPPFDPVGTPNHPVTCVDRTQARFYCEAKGKRLPTEAEWEKAARGTDGYIFPWGDGQPTCSLAHGPTCGPYVANVGLLDSGKSPYGAYDMAGNAAEWVNDDYDPAYYGTPGHENDPQGPPGNGMRVHRGGHPLVGGSFFLRTSARYGDPPPYDPYVGFRCVKDAP
jgi:formylglycine-generating enzyme required for sulfatase activity